MLFTWLTGTRVVAVNMREISMSYCINYICISILYRNTNITARANVQCCKRNNRKKMFK